MAKKKQKLAAVPDYQPATKKRSVRKPDGRGAAVARNGDAPPSLDHISPGLRPLATPCERLAFHAHNPRKHSDEQIARLAASLRTRGQVKNIIASTRTDPPTVVCGNGTLRAALSLNWSHIACEMKALTQGEENALAVIDNQIALESSWDADELALACAELDLGGDERLEAMLEELRKEQGVMLDGDEPADDPGPQIDKAAELQAKWSTERGQLWLIDSKATAGKAHRLLCGDSTKAEDVARVMGGAVSSAVISDPPYSIGMKAYEDDPADWQTIVDACNDSPGTVAAFFMSPRHLVRFGSSLTWKVERALWWHKQADIGFPWHGWHMNSEAILVCSKPGHKWPKSPPSQTDLYQTGPESQKPNYPCQKPAAVISSLMDHCCEAGATVFDPFLGSGTTMVAAEQTARLCYGVELEPKFVAVCLERLAGMGLEPRLG